MFMITFFQTGPVFVENLENEKKSCNFVGPISIDVIKTRDEREKYDPNVDYRLKNDSEVVHAAQNIHCGNALLFY